MNRIRRYYRIVRRQRRPFKFLISRILWRTGLCRLFRIDRDLYSVKFHPSALSALLWIDPSYSSADEIFYDSFLEPGDVVIDIGANIGVHTLSSSAKVGHLGNVISFEPHPRIKGYLEDNIRLNGRTNIIVQGVALGNENGEICFSDTNSDDQNAVATNGLGIMVDVRRLDDITTTNKEISLLKIDVEGYEIQVLEGGKDLLKRTKCVYFEASERLLSKYGYSKADLLQLLKSMGFEIYRMTDSNSITKIRDVNDSSNWENLLAIKDLKDVIRRTGWAVEL